MMKPIVETEKDYDEIEKAIKALFKREVYLPLLRALNFKRDLIRNARKMPGLQEAIGRGFVTYSDGKFQGKFNAQISKELRELGAKYENGSYSIKPSKLPYSIRSAVSASENNYVEKMRAIDEQLAKVMPEELAKKIKVEHFFDKSLYRVETSFQKSIKKISVAPKITPYMRKRIAAEWNNNLQLFIKDFATEEIKDLRHKMSQSVFAGNRYETMVKTVQTSYGVTANKAKFLAKQETKLAMAKYKQTRYQEAGIDWYKWRCVTGSAMHPVRPFHKKNDGLNFRWDFPPTVDEQGHRKNPQQDYNCRCSAVPLPNYKPTEADYERVNNPEPREKD